MEIFTRIERIGKRQRLVPPIFTPYYAKAASLQFQGRFDLGVNPNNPYLFPVVSSLNHICSFDTMRKFASEANLENHEAITSTNLKKQVAIMSQLLNLQDNEMDNLATFLGLSK